mgnify:CR=1 FL=1
MKAFKTFSQKPENERPSGVPLDWPSEVLSCESSSAQQYELLGYTVMSDSDYAAYLASKQAAFDAWNTERLESIRYYKIFDYVHDKSLYDTSVPPLTVDFITTLKVKLHRKSTLVKGECIKEEYFVDCDGTNFSNLIVSEHSTYTRNSLGFPIKKDSHLHFYDTNGIESPETKNWVKWYSMLEQIQEGKTRRGNLIDALQMPCVGLIGIALNGTPTPTSAVILEGRRFLFDYKKEFDAFVDESNKEIVSCFADPAHPRYASITKYPWINSMTPYGVTIRQFLVSELTI